MSIEKDYIIDLFFNPCLIKLQPDTKIFCAFLPLSVVSLHHKRNGTILPAEAECTGSQAS